MPISKRDLAYLWDMRTAVREIMEFMQGVSQSAFVSNNQLRYAVERQLLVIGEAARHVSDGFQEGDNILAIKVYPWEPGDFSVGFVDWFLSNELLVLAG